MAVRQSSDPAAGGGSNRAAVSPGATFRLFCRIILPRLLGYRRNLVLGALLTVLIVGLQLPLPLLTRYIIDTVLPNGEWSFLVVIVLGLAGLALVHGACSVLSRHLMAVARERAMRDIEVAMFEHVQRLPLTFFDNITPGRLVSRVASDVSGVSGLLGETIVSLAVDGLTLIAGIVAILLFDWQLACFALVLLPLFVVSIVAFQKPLQRSAHAMEEFIGRSNSILFESLDGIRITKAYLLEAANARRLRETMTMSSDETIRFARLAALSGSITGFIGALAPLLVFILGGYKVIHQQMTLGTMIAFNAFLGYVFGPTQRMISMQDQVHRAASALSRMDELLGVRPEESSASPHVGLPGIHAIEFQDVHFAYHQSHPVLQGVSATIMSGETVAIVGVSGAGKSTLMHLLLRFYEPSHGRILIDNRDINRLSIDEIRRTITLIPQSAYLFSGTIADNIGCSRTEATLPEIVAAAQLAHADEFIDQLPQGYSTEIGPRGVKLSGGQRQRIAIARAILRDSRILILDEATSEIDAQSERYIRHALDRLLNRRTALIIAHRMSSIQDVGRILVLDRGRIVADGPHARLYDQCEAYRRYYDAQAKAAPVVTMDDNRSDWQVEA